MLGISLGSYVGLVLGDAVDGTNVTKADGKELGNDVEATDSVEVGMKDELGLIVGESVPAIDIVCISRAAHPVK